MTAMDNFFEKYPPFACQAEAEWTFNTTNITTWRAVRKWLIDGETRFVTINRHRNCWWGYAWVQVFGLHVGVGFYIDRGETAESILRKRQPQTAKVI